MIRYSHAGFEYHGLDLETLRETLPAIHTAHFAETEAYFHRVPTLKVERLIALQKQNVVVACGVTEQESGKLAGLVVYYVSESLHCDALVATDDRLYVIPEYRGAGIAKRLLRYGEKRLKERGVTDIFHGSKSEKVNPLFVAAGYQPIATVFHKEL